MEYVGRPNWIDQPVGGDLAGQTIINRFRRHLWETNVMPAGDYDALFALLGQKVELRTTNYSDRNGELKTYFGAELKQVSGNHNGPVFENVRAEFLVRV